MAILLSVWCALAVAREAVPVADDPALERRLVLLSKELRCLVCQNESLADSRADLAADLRNQIREQMRSGQSDEQIKTWLTQRYGDFVLYRTPVKSTTLVLWFGPFALLVAGLAVLFLYLRRRRLRVQQTALSSEDLSRAQALLQGAESDGAAR